MTGTAREQPKQLAPEKEVFGADSLQSDSGFVLIDVESLILGREIHFPIYDRTGILLLARGAIITPKFRRILRERDISKVRMHSEDADLISSSRASNMQGNLTRKENRSQEITHQLRKSVGNGLQFVTNNGAAVYHAVVDHGNNSYCPEKQAELDRKNKEQCIQLSRLMNSAIDSRQLDGEVFRESTYGLLENLCEDFDCVNALASNLTIEDSLAQHCHRMSVLAMSIAVEMGLNDENVCRVGVTGMLHDWGMLRVPEHIRNPQRPLNQAEKIELQKHVIYSVDMLEKISGLPTLVPLVSYQVHEQVNGKGYPRGRRGSSIHLFARILHVAHCYVELTTATAFRNALAPYEATVQLFQYAKEGVLDTVVLRALLRAQSLFPVGSLVMLSSGSMAKVIRANGDRFVDPIVQIVQDQQEQEVSRNGQESVLNLSEVDCKIVRAMPIFHDAEPIPAPHFLKTSREFNAQLQKSPVQ